MAGRSAGFGATPPVRRARTAVSIIIIAIAVSNLATLLPGAPGRWCSRTPTVPRASARSSPKGCLRPWSSGKSVDPHRFLLVFTGFQWLFLLAHGFLCFLWLEGRMLASRSWRRPGVWRCCRTLTEIEHRDDGAFKRYIPGPKTGGFARGSFIAWRRHERVRDAVLRDSIKDLYDFLQVVGEGVT